MAVGIVLKSVEIVRTPDAYGQKQNRAVVTVTLVQAGEADHLEMTFHEDGYQGLDAALEAVRAKLMAFAKDLHLAAHNPLVGTRSGP